MLLRALAALVGLASALSGCRDGSCVGEDDACELGPVCDGLRASCAAPGFARAYRLTAAHALPAGPDALGSIDDFVLENERVRVVVDALEHPHHLAKTGGALLDVEISGVAEDGLNLGLQATGLLPKDAVVYTSARLVEGPNVAALELRGHLAGDPEERVATRYEVRPCELGVRVKTEVANLGRDDEVWSLTDGWFWGNRGLRPFVPAPGRGFHHPDFGLTEIDQVFTDAPFLAAAGERPGGASYAVVPCDREAVSGFHGGTVSSAGTPRRIVAPGDRLVLERFVAVGTADRSVAPAVDLALAARAALHGEPTRTVAGWVERTRGPPGISPVSGSVLVVEPGAEGRPLTHVVPEPSGRFVVSVPAGRALRLEGQSFGRTVATVEVPAGGADVEAPLLVLPEAAAIEVSVTVDGAADDALVFLAPADEETRAAGGQLFGAVGPSCAPILGPPNGSSPACDRALVRGAATVVVAPGRYRVVASRGPFATVDERTVTAEAGARVPVTLALARLGHAHPALSADFHVHGARSFDSSIPDRDRVWSFLAAGLDVLVATDHDVVTDYSATLASLGASGRIVLVPGIETTGLVLFDLVAGETIPKVIGHYNFWPMTHVLDGPWRGGFADEEIEPGTLFDRYRASPFGARGVIQLNHPYAEAEFGRDLGFPKAIGLDAREDLDSPTEDKRQLARVPPGATASNLDHDAQEVMNGTDNTSLLAYRAYWHYLLNQGVLKAGTANSDSHGLTDNVVGTPRTLVYTTALREPFDLEQFDRDVKAGRMTGTNGPVIRAELEVGSSTFTPSLAPLAPAGRLFLEVSAAPWVPVDEVRVVVNGEVVRTLSSELAHPAWPLGSDGLVRYHGRLPLADLLPAAGDAWLVVEAGRALPLAGDLDCDGIPDTSDNDGNGVVDWRDADDNEAEPEPCDGDTGPLRSPREATPTLFGIVTPGGYPFAFTNPFVFDRTGDGYRGAGR